jgi:hypothetical protein
VKRVNGNQTRTFNEGDVTMKKLLMAGLVALAPSASMADSDFEAITVKLDVTKTCTLGTWTDTELDFTASLAADATYPGTTTLAAGAGATCNYGSVEVHLLSANGALDAGNTATTGFTHELAYAIDVHWNGGTPVSTTSTDAAGTGIATFKSAGAITGLLQIDVTPVAATDPMLAGDYTDTLTVTIQPET